MLLQGQHLVPEMRPVGSFVSKMFKLSDHIVRGVLIGITVWVAMPGRAQVTWRRSYGGYDSDRAACVRQTVDGGYILAGSTGSFGHGSGDMYAIRLDDLGDPLWSRTFGGVGVDIGVSCRELSDGFVFAGTTTTGEHGGYDLFLVRTDADGGVLWQRSYGSASWDLCNAMEVLTDGFVLAGISYGFDTPLGAAYVVRTDLLGDTIWTRQFHTAFPSECSGISLSSDGGFILAGSVGTATDLTDGFLTKLSSAGDEVWSSFPGGDSTDYLISVVESPSGDIVACGGTHSVNPFMQVYIVGSSSAGVLQWEQFIGSVADAAGTEIRNGPNSGYVFTGYNTLNLGTRDMILTTIDASGQFQIGNNFGDGEPADGYSVDQTDDGGFVVAGWCENYGPGSDPYTSSKRTATGRPPIFSLILISTP